MRLESSATRVCGARGAQIARRQKAGEVLQLPDGRADSARKPPLGVYGQRQRQHKQGEFQQKRYDHHAVERGAFLNGVVDLHGDVVFQHLRHQRRHVADLLEFGFVVHHGRAVFDLPPQFHHLFAQRVHGAARGGQLHLVGAGHGAHQLVQLHVDLVDHLKKAHVVKGLVAGHGAPGLVGDVHGHFGL